MVGCKSPDHPFTLMHKAAHYVVLTECIQIFTGRVNINKDKRAVGRIKRNMERLYILCNYALAGKKQV